MRLLRGFLLLLFAVAVAACAGKGGAGVSVSAGSAEAAATAVFAKEREQAAAIAAAMDGRLLAAQVLVSGIDGKGQLTPGMKTLLAECPAGAVILFRYNLDTGSESIRQLIEETSALVASQAVAVVSGGVEFVPVNLPPFVAVDHEGGAVNRFLPGVADLPPPGSFWGIAQAEGQEAAFAKIAAESFAAGEKIRQLGCNLNIAPVAEFLADGNRDFLGDRSYGEEPAFVSGAAAAFIRGMEQAGVLCAAKHFPGSAGLDPHRYPSVLAGSREDIGQTVAPFAALVSGGLARAIMVSHAAVPALDSVSIASFSAPVMQGYLRGELGFDGIIICDDFSMAAASGAGGLDSGEAAVRALNAGADMVMVWQPDIRRTHQAIQAAVAEGRLPRQRLEEAAARVIFEKIRMGLANGK